MTHNNRRKSRHRWAGVSGLAAATIMLLAGCVMPDGTVYTAPPEGFAAPVAQEAPAAEDAVVETDPQEEEPSPALPFLSQGDTYFEIGDYEAALEEYDKAIEADPSEPYGYYARGLALANLGDMQRAASDYDRALDLTDGGQNLPLASRVELYTNSAAVHEAQGDLPEVVEDLEQLLDVDPFATELCRLLRVYGPLVDGYNTAVREHETSLVQYGESAGVTQYDSGMQVLLRAMNLTDSYGKILEDPAAAETWFTAAIEADPGFAEAYHARALVRILLGQQQLSRYVLRMYGGDEVTYVDQETGETHSVTPQQYDELQASVQASYLSMLDQAEADLQDALRLKPDMVEAIYDLAVIHYMRWQVAQLDYETVDTTDLEAALPLLDQTVELAPEWDKARSMRAMARIDWGSQAPYASTGTEGYDDQGDKDPIASLKIALADADYLATVDPEDPRATYFQIMAGHSLMIAEQIGESPEQMAAIEETVKRLLLLTGRVYPETAIADVQNQMLRASGMPYWPPRLTTGHLVLDDNMSMVYVNDDAGFRMDIPPVDISASIGDTLTQRGMLCTNFHDNYRHYDVMVLPDALEDLSPEEWIDAQVMPLFESVSVEEPLSSAYGDATVLLADGKSIGLLPINEQVFIFMHSPGDVRDPESYPYREELGFLIDEFALLGD